MPAQTCKAICKIFKGHAVRACIKVRDEEQAHDIAEGLERLRGWCMVTGVMLTLPRVGEDKLPRPGLLAAVAPQLLQCTAFARLELAGCRLPAGDTSALCSLVPSCSSLRLLCIGLDCELAANLAAVLSKQLTCLDLKNNTIREDGARALGTWLSQCSSLTELCLEGNPLRDAGVKVLTEALPGSSDVLVKLNLGMVRMGEEGAFALAAQARTLTALTELNLKSNRVGDKGMSALLLALSSCTRLSSLFLDYNLLRAESAAVLPKLLDDCQRLSVLGLEDTNLREVDTGGRSDALLQLTSLDVSDNQLQDGEWTACARLLQRCCSLKHLNLSLNELDSQALSQLASLALRTSLTSLRLFSCNLGQYSVGGFADMLPSYSALVRLDLSENDLSASSARRLSQTLGRCEHLEELDLCWNEIGAAGARWLVQALLLCRGLRVLRMSHNKIGDDGAGALSDVLGSWHGLQHLELSKNEITHVGIARLATALASCTALTRLELKSNDLSGDGVRALARALRGCSSLTLLDLDSCDIGEDGAVLLAAELPNYARLSTLCLRNNDIREKGARALADVLVHCSALECLHFSFNWVSCKGKLQLREAARALPGGRRMGMHGL